MSGFDYATHNKQNVEENIDTINIKWGKLVDEITEFKTNLNEEGCSGETMQNCDLITDATEVIKPGGSYEEFAKEFKKYMSRVDGSEEFKKHHNNLYDIASMRPIHLSFGVMILSVLIYELYAN